MSAEVITNILNIKEFCKIISKKYWNVQKSKTGLKSKHPMIWKL